MILTVFFDLKDCVILRGRTLWEALVLHLVPKKLGTEFCGGPRGGQPPPYISPGLELCYVALGQQEHPTSSFS